MKKIGLLSDTHNYWDERYETYFAECDEIWHAGDIGSLELSNRFEALKPFRAVYGNIDDYRVRRAYPSVLRFTFGRCGCVDNAYRRLSRENTIPPFVRFCILIHPCFLFADIPIF